MSECGALATGALQRDDVPAIDSLEPRGAGVCHRGDSPVDSANLGRRRLMIERFRGHGWVYWASVALVLQAGAVILYLRIAKLVWCQEVPRCSSRNSRHSPPRISSWVDQTAAGASSRTCASLRTTALLGHMVPALPRRVAGAARDGSPACTRGTPRARRSGA